MSSNGSKKAPNTVQRDCACPCGCTDGINFNATATIPAKPKCSRCIIGIHLNDR